MIDELELCHCGGKAVVTDRQGMRLIECDKCKEKVLHGGCGDYKSSAVYAWNDCMKRKKKETTGSFRPLFTA